jgi:hypothetical protein
MTTTRKQYTPKFKAKVALEAICGERTLDQLGPGRGANHKVPKSDEATQNPLIATSSRWGSMWR